MDASVLSLAAESAPSAGGAELAQVAIASGFGATLTAALLILGFGHRSGRLGVLRWAGNLSGRVLGLPGWAALPLTVATPTLLLALFGLTWDESLHIDSGRDPGPLANPSHYFLLVGLFGVFSAGWLALVMPEGGERPGPASVRITREWYVPVGGLLTMVCASVALLGFPLDDVSHRLFGQDVTLWGTTHLQMLTGAATAVVGMCVLFREGTIAARTATAAGEPIGYARPRLVQRIQDALSYATLGGGLLGALSIFQGEFDFGVPQFRLVFHPILIAGMAAFALVAVRALAGPGAAVLAALWFVAIRGVITLLVGPVFGEAVASFPLYLAEALIVEVVALMIVARARPYTFGAVSGALIGSVGVLAEYGWTHVWMPLPWPSHLLPEAVALSVPVAVAAGLVGAFLFCGLDRREALTTSRPALATIVLSALVIAGVIVGLRTTDPVDARASVTLTQVRPAPDREVVATVRLDPPDAARDADWFTTLAYQGKEPLRLDTLKEIAPGVFRTVALPVHSRWKTVLRLHRGSQMSTMPFFLPGDAAIPAAQVPATASFVRPFTRDKEVLQRERKDDVPLWGERAFALLILAISLGLLATLGRGLMHLARSRDGEGGADGAAAAPASAARRGQPVA
ncbi:MAG: hypothetical protein JWO02_1395 [Solirubrobacterales bacterium]|nr:hypothetical protein [Solirubrobacterales bacterium]